MSDKNKQITLLIILIIIMVGTYSYRFFYRSITKEQYNLIHNGMSVDEVRELLAQPVKISRYYCSCHGHSEVWRYNIKYSLSAVSIWFKPDKENKMCVFDKTLGFD